MSKSDAAGCMVQWAVELSQFDIKYRPRTARGVQPDLILDQTAKPGRPSSKTDRPNADDGQ